MQMSQGKILTKTNLMDIKSNNKKHEERSKRYVVVAIGLLDAK